MIEYPDTDEIQPEEAKFLYEHHCAILIIEDLPTSSEFGIDLVVFRTGEKFKGIKLIPPGIHLIYASSVDRRDVVKCGPRSGFFHNFKPKELLIKRWSSSQEEFDQTFEPDEEYKNRYSSNLRDLDRYLGAYKFSTYKTFTKLIDHITVDLVEILVPDCKTIRSVPYLVRHESKTEATQRTDSALTRTLKSNECDLLPDLKPAKATIIHFTQIPKKYSDSNQCISGEMITKYNLDTTMKLEYCFPNESGRQRLLGELQFAFIVLTYCHVYDCLEHWKQLINVVCLADSGLRRYPHFYGNFIKIVYSQLEQIPEDLFSDILDSDNLIRCHLDTLFQNISTTENNQLNLDCIALKKLAEEKFGWIFDLERDDEQPVIVDI